MIVMVMVKVTEWQIDKQYPKGDRLLIRIIVLVTVYK